MWIIGAEAKYEGDQVEKLMLNAEKKLQFGTEVCSIVLVSFDMYSQQFTGIRLLPSQKPSSSP